jgi:hypothetical protein
MANATAITLNALTANGAIIAPTAQVLDTGSSPVTLATSVTSEMDRIIIEVTNAAAGALGVVIEAGDNPPAFRAALGDTTSQSIAQNARYIFGPFESARFANDDGKLYVTFSPAATINATFIAYRLPKV